MSDKAHYHIFCDGSCTGVGVGAWAGLVISANQSYKKPLYGILRETTINRCELTPIIEGLNHIRKRLKSKDLPVYGTVVSVVSDSEYTVKTLSSLNLDDVKSNRDLWYAYAAAAEGFTVDATWVQRNSHPYMRTADAMCYGLRKFAIDNIEKSYETMALPDADPKLQRAE